nr:hypothetical protein [uncultured Prevotella sp.]
MARTVSEIKKTMTDAFMADANIREKYGLKEGDTWSRCFSSVSLENIIFFIVAACSHVLEAIFEQYTKDVDEKVSMAVVASVPWYYKMALAFQYGDSLVLNETTQQYVYANIDESKQVVKYAAVRDRGTSVQILVSGDKDGKPVALSNSVLTVFKEYMNRVKVAGVVLNISSKESDKLSISATISVDSLVIDENGVKLSDGTMPIEEAIENHLKDIQYGGTFNKTKLISAILSVDGVEDVELGTCSYKRDGDLSWTTLAGNNYIGESGSYIPEKLSETLSYVV